MTAFLKNRVRGPNLAVFISNVDGPCVENALRRADEAGLVIASNKRMSKALIGSNDWKQVWDVFACWTGTMAAYDKPNMKIGKTIEYTDPSSRRKYLFPVPEEHQGKKNVILVAEHPDFTLEMDGKTTIVQAKKVGIIDEFPLANGYYQGDPKFDIPSGGKIDCDNQDARYLWRVRKWIGLVARVKGEGMRNNVLGIYLNEHPSDWRGVAIENPLPTNDAISLSMSKSFWNWALGAAQKELDIAARLLKKLKVK